MAFEADFLDLMKATATHKAYASFGGYGDETFGASTTIPCHITYTTRMVRSNTEEAQTSSAQIQCPPGGFAWSPTQAAPIIIPTIKVQDQIVLADGIARRVLSVDNPTDEDGGVHHQAIFLT